MNIQQQNHQITFAISDFNMEVIETIQKKFSARVEYMMSKTSFFCPSQFGELAVGGLKGHRTLSGYLLLQRYQAHQTSIPESLRSQLTLSREGVFFRSADAPEIVRVFQYHFRDLLSREQAWVDQFGPRWRQLRRAKNND